MNQRNNIEVNGPLIRQLRRQLNWTQADLAQKAGYSERLIGKAEGSKSIATSTLQDICDAFGEAGKAITVEELSFDPVAKAREFIWGMYTHKADVIDQCQHFISDDVVIDINGDPNVFPFAGHHVGIDAARKAFHTFYSVLQPPDDISELESFQFISTGHGALVWGDTWTHPIGQTMEEPIKLAIRMDFRDGMLTHFDDRFDAPVAQKHFRTASETSVDDLILIVRQWFDLAFNQRDLSAIDKFMHPDIRLFAEGDELSGRDAIRIRVKTLLDAFDPIQLTIDQVVCESDTVVCYWSVTKKHVGEFASIQPTGKTVKIRGSSMARIEDGQIVEARDHWDVAHLLEMLTTVE